MASLWLRLVSWMHRRVCIECHGFILPWQPRHRFEHTACKHAAMRRLYEQNRAVTPTEVFPMWPCVECGVVP